jgi:pimeloyl-ACP methyl ester carboxylesterase
MEHGRESLYFHARGHRLYGEWIDREKEGPVLVFLHEGLGSTAQWKDFPELLCERTDRPGFVFDRLGHGKSDPLSLPRDPGYLHEEAFFALPETLDGQGIEKSVLIGHSDGGTIALLFAARFPGRVSAVITEAAHVFVEDVTLKGIRKAVDLYGRTDLRKRLSAYHGSNTEGVFRGWADTWLDPRFRDWNTVSELSGVRCPLLVIQGEGDEYGTAIQVMTIAEKTSGPAEAWLVPDCGHIPHLQAKEAVLRRMADFIEATTGRDTGKDGCSGRWNPR